MDSALPPGGIPDPVVAIDFESFYSKEYSLRKMSTFAYCRDPRFDAYMLSVHSPGYQWVGRPRDFHWELLRGKTLLAHNALFEEHVLRRLVKDGIVPAWVLTLDVLDTADLAAFLLCRRSLDVAAKNLLGIEVSKQVRTKMQGVAYESLPSDAKAEVLAYAGTDTRISYELYLRHGHKWPAHERAISQASRRAAMRGMRVDLKGLDDALSSVKNQLFDIEKAIPWDFRAEGYKTPLAPTLLRAACMEAHITFPASTAKDSEDFVTWLEEEGSKTTWGPVLAKWRKMNTLLTKLETVEESLDGDRFSFGLKYHGAHTGRWSGDEGFNMQNLYRDEIFGVDLRGLFLPDEGCELLIGDYSAIEPRLLWWQVGDERMLDMLRKGWNAYHAHATNTMGWPADLPLKELYETKDPRALAVYPLAKARVLGLGYGCGHKKFFTLANSWGIPLTAEQAVAAVYDYRDSNPLVTEFWRARQQAVLTAARLKQSEYRINMASGRAMVYFEPRTRVEKREGEETMREAIVAKDWMGDDYRYVYGGKITENVIQALGRDVLVDGWWRLIQQGHGDRIHFTSHDEFVASVPKADAQELRKEFGRILSTPPEWAPDLPLENKPKLFDAYTK